MVNMELVGNSQLKVPWGVSRDLGCRDKAGVQQDDHVPTAECDNDR